MGEKKEITRTTVYLSKGLYHARQYLYRKSDFTNRVITARSTDKQTAIKIRDERVNAALETGEFYTYQEMLREKELREKGLSAKKTINTPWPERLKDLAAKYNGSDNNDFTNDKLIRTITDVLCDKPNNLNNQIIAKIILDLRKTISSQTIKYSEDLANYQDSIRSFQADMKKVPYILEVDKSMIFRYNVTIKNPVTNAVILAYSTNKKHETTLKYILKHYDAEKYNLKNIVVRARC